MVTLHPSILKRKGRKAFAVLPYEEFLRVQEQLEDYADLKALRAATTKEKHASATPLHEVRRKLQI